MRKGKEEKIKELYKKDRSRSEAAYKGGEERRRAERAKMQVRKIRKEWVMEGIKEEK